MNIVKISLLALGVLSVITFTFGLPYISLLVVLVLLEAVNKYMTRLG